MKFSDLKFDKYNEALNYYMAKVQFPNGFGASIIPYREERNSKTFELAILKNGTYFDSVEETILSSAMFFNMTEEEIEDKLAIIEALPISSEEIKLWLQDSSVKKIINFIIDNDNNECLPILADALEDIDCQNKVLLEDLRTSKRDIVHWFIILIYENFNLS